MHCVSARTRSRKALIHLKQKDSNIVKEQRSSNNGDEVVRLSSDDDVISWEQENEMSASGSESSDSDPVEAFDVDHCDSDSDSRDNEVQIVHEEMNDYDDDEGRRRISERKWKRESNIDEGEFGVRRRKAFGLDILISEDAREEGKNAAQRTRSHYRRSKKSKLGTISQPICLDEEDQNHSHSEEDKDHSHSEEDKDHFHSKEDKDHSHSEEDKDHSHSEEDQDHSHSDWEEEENHYECVRNKGRKKRFREPNTNVKPSFSREESTPEKSECEKELDEIWAEMESALEFSQCNSQVCCSQEGSASDEEKHRGCWEEGSAFSKKKHARHVEDCDVLNDLENFIYGVGEVNFPPLEAELNPNMDFSPSKLPFQISKEPEPVERSEYEKELDALWVEMEYCLYGNQHNSVPASQVQNNGDSDHDRNPMGEVSTATLCRQGKHNLILNEEIGLICAYCLHIDLEIKYIVPPFYENPFGRSKRRDPCTFDHEDHSVFDELQHGAAGHDDCNHCNYSGTVWDIIPGVKNTMYPHQCEAFEFLWSNLAGGIFLDKLKEQNEFPDASGCIISHAPGTGKTRLAIVFIQTYMELYPACRPMIIAPKGMLLTWEEEFKTWKVDIPFHNMNSSDYSGKESEVAMNFIGKSGHNLSRRAAKLLCRKAKLYSWKFNKSILGISYKLFEQLTRSKNKELRKVLLENPGLLVLDEGHTPRNSGTLILKAVSEIQTKKRIILSGTPFQNNFDELYNTLYLARPKFAEWNSSGGKAVFDDKRVLPKNESKEKWVYLTSSFGKVIDDNRKFKILEEIRKMIRPFVHVHRGTILQESLPGLSRLVVILKPTQLQKEILEDIQKHRKSCLNVLKLEYAESVTAVHPALYDLSEGKKLHRFRLNPNEGVKTKFLMELIRLSGIVKEKVLVFSEHINPLKLVASQLKHHFGWAEGEEVLQIHGKVEARLRQASMKAFNDPNSKVRVMLASIKACYEGISLIGASRVVLLDVVWNPSVEWQAICRAYRLGQKKFVYTYRLITAGTRDEEKCCRQAEKDHLSEMVFFNSDEAQHWQDFSSAELEDRILESMLQPENFGHIFAKVAVNY